MTDRDPGELPINGAHASGEQLRDRMLAEGLGSDPLASVVRATRMPVCITDPRLPDNPIVFANLSFCKLIGYSQAELIGRNCRFLQGPGTDGAAVRRLRDAIAAEQSIEVDLLNYRKGGEPFWNRLLIAPVHNDEGELAYFFASQVDVTIERERLDVLVTDNARLTIESADRLTALAASDARLRLATEAGDIGTWDLDLMANVLTWTDKTRAMFGVSPGVPCSMEDFYGGLHPDDREATSEAFAAALDPARRLQYDVEYRTIGKEDRVTRWVAAKGVGLFEGERCIRAIGTAVDITVRRRARERQMFFLAVSDELRNLADARAITALAAIRLGEWLGANRVGYGYVQDDDETSLLETGYVYDAEPVDGPVPLASFGAEAVARNRAGETDVCNDTEVSPGLDVESWRAIGTRAFITVPLVREGRLRASLFVNRNQPHDWNADDVRLIEEIAERTWEASERARAELELQASEARLRAVVDAAPIGLVFGEAPDGRIVGGNAQAERILRHPILPSPNVDAYREYVGFHPDGRQVEGAEYPLARALIGEERPEIEVLYRRGDGSEAFVRFIAAPVRGADGTIIGGVVASLDVDRERRAEAALIDLNATLEARVEERSHALAAAERALRQAQKMEAVGQLTGGIAHDFNNMLSIVLGSLELLERRLPLDDLRARKYVEAASDGARRAATLTQRLLAFSRRQPLNPEPIDANKLVTGMAELLRGSLGGAVSLECVFAGGLWTIHADRNQLENIILNLGINARDAMPDGGRLTIETQNAHLDDRYAAAAVDVTPGHYVLIAVTDTGMGMTKDVAARAFDPFFTTKEVGKGTGLGLSQVYGFVRQSGGHVAIYSEPGMGTTVKLYLPRFRGVDRGEVAALADADVVMGAGEDLILVVEDEPAVRAMTVAALRELGFRVIEAGNANAALAALERTPDIALLFTDVIMPETDGAKLADMARKLRPDLKILFMTGYTRDAVVHNGTLDHGVNLIGKPFTMQELASKVQRVLGSDRR